MEQPEWSFSITLAIYKVPFLFKIEVNKGRIVYSLLYLQSGLIYDTLYSDRDR